MRILKLQSNDEKAIYRTSVNSMFVYVGFQCYFCEVNFITKYFPTLTSDQVAKFVKLIDLYRYWNAQVNLISRKDIDNLEERHLLHSLSIAKFHSFIKGTEIIDVGTGGGLPGIPLAILWPHIKFHLIDSIAKKIKVVDIMVIELGLTNVTTEIGRIEASTAKADFVVSRAVSDLRLFYKLVRKAIKKESANKVPNGIIYLKGGDIEPSELKGLNKIFINDIKTVFEEEFFETKKIIYIPVA